MSPYLTIIVPIYKVEAYLARCLDSISDQTFTDFECILVDDGSPDKCGKICDEYALKDNRFVIIHQENSGLSDARNNALKRARGKIVSFVDSDDWILPNMYERMVQLLQEYEADIVMCDYISERRGYKVSENSVKTYSGHDFTCEVLKDNISSQLWKFIYKKELWDGIISPSRRHAQDMMILHKVTNRADIVVATQEKLYGYNDTRGNNISNSKKNSVKNHIDRALAFFYRMDFCIANGYSEDIQNSVLSQAVGFAVNVYYDNILFTERYKEDSQVIRNYFNKYKKEIDKLSIRWDYKVRCRLISFNPKLAVFLYKIKSKIWNIIDRLEEKCIIF